jgi:hypothetical protein
MVFVPVSAIRDTAADRRRVETCDMGLKRAF